MTSSSCSTTASGVDPDFLEWDLNEWDAFSLEAALQLREQAGRRRGRGGHRRRRGVRGGAAELPGEGRRPRVRVWDDALAGADPLAVARVLAAAVERESRRSRAVRRAVLRCRQRRHRGGARRLSRISPHVAVVKRARARRGRVDADRRARARGRPGRAPAGAAAGAADDPDGHQPAALRDLRAIKQAREKPLEVVDARRARPRRRRARGRRRLAPARAVAARPRRRAPR